ncbi:MAG: serine/threonine-protein kinase [Gemmataceae bacterium]
MAHDSVDPSLGEQTLAHDSVESPADAAATLAQRVGGKAAHTGRFRRGGSTVRPGEIEALAEVEAVPGYEILGELGRGAMGVVYKALQVGLKRVVALKMILSGGHASAAEVVRFRTEAEAVARLQHPYIVQVFEIGEHRGLPFFSLEFVDGGCLADRVLDDAMPLRQAAEVVLKLAEGMACAHENGIIHRDLKPANVLMTRDGDPKITDFGLAKKLEEDSGATRAGAIMGTPSYMAPEQAEGRVDLVGPHSDIYALGAILYDLITGRPPFRGATLMETLTQVRANDPVPPARLHPKMPRDLETITLKCLLKEPKKRYHTARDLAEDLRRFLAGEPILARPVSSLERAWKWCKRRPTAAALVAVSALSLVLMAGGGVAYAQSEKRRAEEADRLRKEANAQRDRAEGHFRQAREAVDQMLSRVGQEQLGYEPRMEQVRRDLLEKAASFYERFLEAEGDDPAVRQEAAMAARKVGDVRGMLGQGKEAENAYRRSLQLLDPLVEEHPEVPSYRQDLAAACNNLANLLRDSRRLAEAEPLNERATQLLRVLADELPGEPVWRRELASAYYNRALLDEARGKPVPAAMACRTALNLQQRLITDSPNEAQSRGEAARTWTVLGRLRSASHPVEAEQAMGEAMKLLEQLAREMPRNARVREDLLVATVLLGDLLRNTRPDEAGPLLRRAVDVGEKLVADFPTVPDYKQKLAGARNNLGLWQLADNRRAAALTSFEKALALKQRLADNFPNQPVYQRDLAGTEANLGLQLVTAGLAADAAPLYRRAADALRALVRDHPGHPADERELALALVGLASVEPASAEKSLREALAIQERLVKADPRSREYLADRAASRASLAAILLSRGLHPEAEALLALAEVDYRELMRHYPDEPVYRFSLASARINQGELWRTASPPRPGAEPALREAGTLLGALAKSFPGQARFAREQAKALHDLGLLLTDTRRYAEAEATHNQALTLRTSLADQFKEEPAYRQDLAASHAALAVAQTYRNSLQAAEKNFGQAIGLLRRLVERQPAEVGYGGDLAKQLQNHARLLHGLGRDDDAAQQWRQAVSVRESVAKQQPASAQLRADVGDACQQLAQALLEYRRWDEAITSYQDAARNLRQALKLAPGSDALGPAIFRCLAGAAEACLGKRDHAAAARAVTEALEAAPGSLGLYPLAASALARCAGLAAADPTLDEAKRKVIAKGYADRAMVLLNKAVAGGYKDVPTLSKGKEFEALRERDDFKKLLAEMAKK